MLEPAVAETKNYRLRFNKIHTPAVPSLDGRGKGSSSLGVIGLQ